MASTSVDPALAPALELPAPRRRSLLADVAAEIRALGRYRSLLRYLVSASFRTENANTVLGYVWWLLDPLLLAVVYVIFLRILLRGGPPDFAIFVFTAVVSWQFFSKGVTKSITTTVSKERTMRQVSFPRTVLPLSTVLSAGIGFLFAIPVLLVAAIPFGITPHPIALLMLPIAAVQLIFTLGLAFFFSALHFFFRDTQKFITYSFRMWFFLSPALYPVSLVPERFRDLYELNPFATFFPAFQTIVMEHEVPDLMPLAIVTAMSVVVLLLGFLFFVRSEPWFAKLV